MVTSLRRSGQWVVMVMEVEKEEYNEERGQRRDSETGAASDSKKTSLALAREDMLLVYEGGGQERSNED
jgi:hypothetical protein